MLLFYLILLLVSPATYSYNIDTIDPVTLSSPTRGEYFGYSAAVQKSGGSSWVLVGAPTANMTLSDGTEGSGWGAVYNCSSQPSHREHYQCVRVLLDDVPPVGKEVKDGQWTGVTISANPVTYDVVTCAHRYTKRGFMNTDNEVGMRGRCWRISSQAKVQELPELCNNVRSDMKLTDRCSAGISSAYQDDFIDVGGVGYNDWTGRVMFYNSNLNVLANPNLASTGKYTITFDYFGYSMASCYDKEDSMTYLFVGAPRARLMKGKVDYVRYQGAINSAILTKPLANGFDFGSYFGASVTCGYTKLAKIQVLIGAPTWFDDRISGDFDRGRVYLYEVNKKAPDRGSFPKALIPGPKAGGRFGAVVSVIGDINKDGYDDLAIGAPADLSPDQGRVYIYLGSTRGFTSHSIPQQVLSPTPSKGAPLYGFGSSISGGSDVDYNGYPDLVVGAFYSDAAYIYRTLPIINIKVKQLVPLLVDKNDACSSGKDVDVACFILDTCVEYLPGDEFGSVKFGFSLKVTNILDSENDKYSKRVQFSNDTYVSHSNISGFKYGVAGEVCLDDETVFLEKVITNIKQLISIRTEVEVIPLAKFENRLALNDSRDSYAVSQVKIKTACANATCETDLILTSSEVHFDKDGVGARDGVLYSGSTEVIWANYSITRNTSLGKPFGSHLIITMAQSMYITTVRGADGTRLSICTVYKAMDGYYFCTLDEKLDRNVTTQFNFSVEYSVTGVKDTKEVIIRTELVTEGSEDKNLDNNQLIQNILVRRLARLILQGTSSPSRSLFQIRDKDTSTVLVAKDIGGAIETTFLPVNYGPGDLNDLQLIIEVPFALSSVEGEDFIYPYKVESSTDITCEQQFLNVRNIRSGVNLKRAKRSNREPRPSTLGEIQDSLTTSVGGESEEDTPNQLSFACERDVHCINISCSISKLSRDVVGIRLTSYVWEATFQEPLRINTSVRAWVANQDTGADLTSNSLPGPITVPLKVIAVANLVKPVSIWIIVGSISGGLCFLGLIVIILYKVGFFNRKRPPKAEFYGDGNTNRAVKEVVDDTHDAVEPYSTDTSDDETQFAFRNPLCDSINM